MKKIVLALLLLILDSSSFAQKIRFTDSANVWKGFNIDLSTYPITTIENYTASYLSDSVVNGHTYKVLFFNIDALFIDLYLIREDTLTSKVYAKNPAATGFSSDTTEQILYDYNWRIGDTVNRDWSEQHFKNYVYDIDSTLINGTWYKVWHFEGTSGLYDVIEGIGCVSDPAFPMIPSSFESYIQLTCFSNNGFAPAVSPKVGNYFDNATSCTLAVNDIIKKNKNAVVSPNPITTDSKITLPYSISSGTLVVLNDIGQTIINTPFQNKDELLIGDKVATPGIFFYRVTDKSTGNVFAGKFVYR